MIVPRSAHPLLDPELATALAQLPADIRSTITADAIPRLRREQTGEVTQRMLDDAGIEADDAVVTGYDGAEIGVTILRPKGRTGTGAGFYHVHGGGMILGDRWTGVTALFDALHRFNAVAVTVEYRLAPEFPDPTPIEDCYAGLLWMDRHAGELGVDPDRLMIVGGSAGGGLAAGTALLARDRHGPALCGQLLMYPMLDDRETTTSTSSHQADGGGPWNRESNRTGWTALLGERRGTDAVSIYAAPARATDLSGLPPAFIDCGSAEIFRDEDVAYASAIWAAGGDAELHVWPGGFHAFDVFVPESSLARRMIRARQEWLARILGSGVSRGTPGGMP
ncbi:alpha/beta hydrolase [Herbiconiux ginsengi]|uniref:Acetyl esterase/lipase n=1 Tax=Herbiconiux ginsengi TaxID=381665 RepID=A0A1H3S0T0_9MICO|nr:alpha/beta hydrolase [Herbiconiux ginsengi]SDZ31387.1 Acetyl esterase/lipase [Herbiconiux ginsengi]